MKNKWSVALFLIFFAIALSAQQVGTISSAGGFFKNSSGSVSFTIGECFVGTFNSANLILSQGFQSELIITDVQEVKQLDFEITAFPNPVKGLITLKVENPKDLYYILYDLNGGNIEKKTIDNAESVISFENLAPSTYFIKVFQKSFEIKVIKIVKQ